MIEIVFRRRMIPMKHYPKWYRTSIREDAIATTESDKEAVYVLNSDDEYRLHVRKLKMKTIKGE